MFGLNGKDSFSFGSRAVMRWKGQLEVVKLGTEKGRKQREDNTEGKMMKRK